MRVQAIALLCLAIPALAAATPPPPPDAEAPDAEALIAAAIEYHDPGNRWPEGVFRLEIGESRPDGSTRTSRVTLDNGAGRFELSTERDGDRIEARVEGEECEARVNGSSEIDEETREKHRLSCDRLQRMRNYYAYLWGMPMKLRDPGTRIDPEVAATTFDERPVWRVGVTYDEAVGGDTWYFYFDPDDSSLIGYRFYHDEAANDGEYIYLEDEVAGGGLRLPAKRAWYTHQGDRYLGTDTLRAID